MNQILYNNNDKNIFISNNKKNSIIYKSIFYFSISFAVFLIFLLIIRYYQNMQNEQISKKLADSYFISTLYSNSTTYSANKMKDYETPFVIRHNKNRQN